jgi:DNA invertase Pin-like site-specific DNA recombinase
MSKAPCILHVSANNLPFSENESVLIYSKEIDVHMDLHSFFKRVLFAVIYVVYLNGAPVYVGQTVQTNISFGKYKTPEQLLKNRKKRHRCDAVRSLDTTKAQRTCRVFCRAINKHGFDAFEFRIHEVIRSSSEVELKILTNDAEIKAVKTFNTLAPNGYNLTAGGLQNTTYSEESRRAISAGIRKTMTAERKKTISDQKRKLTDEERQQCVNLYTTTDLSINEIAKRFGVTGTTVSNTAIRPANICIEKSRGKVGGELHGMVKYSEEFVRKIYAKKGTQTGRATAKELGVTPQYVSNIWNKKKWKHILVD